MIIFSLRRIELKTKIFEKKEFEFSLFFDSYREPIMKVRKSKKELERVRKCKRVRESKKD